MEENKYKCPHCGTEMIAAYQKPALNLVCPKCGCKIATSKWDDIDLDDNDYEIVLESLSTPTAKQLKIISELTGLNFISSKNLLSSGGILLKAKPSEIKLKLKFLDEAEIAYRITPDFPY